MAQSNWEADKMLDVYIYDYLVKKKLHNTAKSFMNEGKVSPDPVAIDAPGGFLFEWWSVFWDIFIARTNDKHSESAAAYIEAQQNKDKEQQLQMQQLQLMRQAQFQRRDPNHPNLGGPVNSVNYEGMLSQSNASALAAKMYEDRMKHPNSVDSETSQPLLDARMALLKSAGSHPGQLVQGNPGSVTAAFQQMQSTQQTTDIKGEMNLGATQRSLPMDPSSIYGQGIMQSKPGIGNTGLSPGSGGLPLKGWPLTGIEQIRPTLGAQVQRPFLQVQGSSQFQLLPQQQQQQLLAQAQGQNNLLSSPVYGDMNAGRFRGLSRGTLNAKDGQPNVNDGSIGSPMQSSSSKMNAPHMQQSSSQQQDPLQQQQSQQNNRKRKGASSSGPANSTGTGNTVGPSPNSQPSTPSTHTPGEGVAIAGNLQHSSNMSKGLMMYAADGAAALASSTNPLEDLEHFADVGSLDDNVESFLSHDDGDGRDVFGTLKRNPSEHNAEASKGFSFSEVGSIRKSNGKVVCCHFSTDGKVLASAGHDKKVVLWNMETLQTEFTPEEHTHIITDVRFRPNSTQLATSSFDASVRLWDSAEPRYSLQTYTGHTSHVMSLDFHPNKNDLFCSCDGNNEIRFWSISQYSCTRISKGATAQVRFQPRLGQLLAGAAENVVAIFDVETDRQTLTLRGHSTQVNSICWDANGDYLASVSQECVKVWSLTSGDCIHEVNASGNKFHSCVFHPSYSSLLVIGGYQSMEVWSMADNKFLTVPAHECVIAALAQSPVTSIVASASHDTSVKIWK
ncbi:WD-40 repeat family protein [Tripterygium wilfordii]|uniref:WD-40 repeat family protein n=1 Tax=Tripterygium wilfordii TaxID=458696 RepID=A0A7J7E1J8_TRIWF|nr:transcriptional corepressor LEUNIG_HOMOLOG-like [Tripterygium wilfordii]XP_038704856.1 transcriptional corepressor LEUNIG_HOMOLOG-like [Tripterygium wilfordii]KAF5752478.1 WD-40 repeat family protein [Tripterygium wilfordii]